RIEVANLHASLDRETTLRDEDVTIGLVAEYRSTFDHERRLRIDLKLRADEKARLDLEVCILDWDAYFERATRRVDSVVQYLDDSLSRFGETIDLENGGGPAT